MFLSVPFLFHISHFYFWEWLECFWEFRFYLVISHFHFWEWLECFWEFRFYLVICHFHFWEWLECFWEFRFPISISDSVSEWWVSTLFSHCFLPKQQHSCCLLSLSFLMLFVGSNTKTSWGKHHKFVIQKIKNLCYVVLHLGARQKGSSVFLSYK